MYIVKISGGLGNQMFQYVFGEYLRKVDNVEVKYEISFYENQPDHLDKRNFELEKFDIDFNIISNELYKYKYIHFLMHFLLNPISNYIPIKERTFDFSKKLPKFLKNRFYSGFWQNEGFLEGLKVNFLDIFQLKDEWNIKKINQKHLDKILTSNSISMGVRRGDYVSINAIVCDLNYYHNAAKMMHEKIGSKPTFFIFSDDIEWCKENLNLEYEHYFVDANQEIPFENMELMAKCKHNIISNSTYDWWGAYLNNNKEKIVISPEQWDFVLNDSKMLKI